LWRRESALIVSKALASNAGNFRGEAFCNPNEAASARYEAKKAPPSLQREDGAFYRPGF
jgi:hypothetical protein